MSRGPVILAVVSALFLGAALGFMSGVMFTNHHFVGGGGPRMSWRSHGRGGPGGPGGVQVMPSQRVILPWLKRTLHLTPEQEKAIRAEITKSRADLAGVHDSLHMRIARHLTPEQREHFARVVNERFPGDHRGRRPHTYRFEPGDEGDPK